MSFAEEFVIKINKQLKNPKLRLDVSAQNKTLKNCALAVRRINIALKNAKLPAEKSHLTTCLSQIKGFRRLIKGMKVIGFGYESTKETAKDRVIW